MQVSTEQLKHLLEDIELVRCNNRFDVRESVKAIGQLFYEDIGDGCYAYGCNPTYMVQYLKVPFWLFKNL